MDKLLARLFFCSGPAMMFGLAAGLAFQSLAVAIIVCLAMFGFGLQITKDTKEGRKDE